MKFNKRLLWAFVFVVILSLCWMNSSSISTVLLAIKGTITDGNLIKFSGSAGLGEDAGIGIETTGEVNFGAHSAGFTLQTTTGDGTTTIDWKLGNKFKFTFGAQSDIFTFTAPTNPCHLTLMLVQDGTGGRDATFPASVKWLGTQPTWTDGGAGKTIIMSMFYDGTYYWSQGTSWEA